MKPCAYSAVLLEGQPCAQDDEVQGDNQETCPREPGSSDPEESGVGGGGGTCPL